MDVSADKDAVKRNMKQVSRIAALAGSVVILLWSSVVTAQVDEPVPDDQTASLAAVPEPTDPPETTEPAPTSHAKDLSQWRRESHSNTAPP